MASFKRPKPKILLAVNEILSLSLSLAVLLHVFAALTQYLFSTDFFFSLPDLLHILSDHTQPQLNAIWHPGYATTDLETRVNKV